MAAHASLPRRALWWGADYLYAGWRQLALIAPRWSWGWRSRSPRAWERGSEDLPEVMLLPGVYEHWSFLRPLGDAVSQAGYRVRVMPGMGANRRSVAETSRSLRHHLDSSAASAAGRILVAHSKGGLIGKHLLVAGGDDILGLVAIATPFAGSSRARMLHARSIRAFLPTDETIVMLGGSAGVNGRIVSIFGPYDPHIPEGSALDGATNILVPTAGHFRILGARATHHAVLDALKLLRTHATLAP